MFNLSPQSDAKFPSHPAFAIIRTDSSWQSPLDKDSEFDFAGFRFV